jgi:F-type H+-transporting ATPase subunit b
MKFVLRLSVLALLLCAGAQSRVFAQSQESSSAPSSSQSSEAEKPKQEPTSIGGELAKQEREATGEEEENANLKHSPVVKWIAKKTHLSVHQAHLLAIILNFALIVPLGYWFANKLVFWITEKKGLKDLFRSRTESIQHALEEARAASQDANRRLTEIENRLRQLDVEIGRMQASAEKEGDAEEARIRTAAEEDIRKVIESAEQEIAAAAKQARREITAHTADLAIALAQRQISVDSHTDQVLVRAFASKLSQGGKDGN